MNSHSIVARCQPFRPIFLIIAGLLTLSAAPDGARADVLGSMPTTLGQWESTWDEGGLATPKALADQHTIWQRAEALPSTGVHPKALWYRIRIPDGTTEGSGVLLDDVRYRFSAFIGDNQVASFGAPDDPAARRYAGLPAHLIPLPANSAGKWLSLRLPADLPQVGIYGEARVGRPSDLLLTVLREDAAYFIAAFIAITIGFLAAGSALYLRKSKLLGEFAALCLGIGVYSLIHTKLLSLIVPFPLVLDYVQYGVTYATPAAFLAFSQRALGGNSWRWNTYVGLAFCEFALLTIALSFAGLIELPSTLPLFQLAVFATSAAFLIEIRRHLYLKTSDSRIIALSMTLIAIAATHDILTARGLVPWRTSIVPWFMIASLGLLTFIVLRNMLRNDRSRYEIDAELGAGAMMQARFMPKRELRTKAFALNAFSTAASAVSGDWFMYRIVHDRWLHIHVGDVTGHGIPAALLATFAKGAVDLYYEESLGRQHNNPALDRLHFVLNKTLISLECSDASMTLVSASIDLQTGAIDVVNSGHPSPLVFSADRNTLKPWRPNNQTLLGLDPNFTSAEPSHHRLYLNDTIILFSDGITEVMERKTIAAAIKDIKAIINRASASANNIGLGATGAVARLAYSGSIDIGDDVTILAVQLVASNLEQRPS